MFHLFIQIIKLVHISVIYYILFQLYVYSIPKLSVLKQLFYFVHNLWIVTSGRAYIAKMVCLFCNMSGPQLG